MGKHKELTEDQILQAFEEYKADIKSRPFKQHDFIGGKDLHEVHRKKERPLTLVGFYNYCFNHYSDVHNYFENTDGRYEKYKGITIRIREEIRQDQVEGGMAGVYNSNLTARLNGIKEQTDITSKDKEIKLPPYMMPKDESKS